jgi:aspartate/methionine/tyrosine aminotransferase
MNLASEILEKCGVGVTPGLDFDVERGNAWMRFSFAGEHKRMVEAFDRLDLWLARR